MKTKAPSSMKRFAAARPMPVAPPVITAVFPFSLVMTCTFLGVVPKQRAAYLSEVAEIEGLELLFLRAHDPTFSAPSFRRRRGYSRLSSTSRDPTRATRRPPPGLPGTHSDRAEFAW